MRRLRQWINTSPVLSIAVTLLALVALLPAAPALAQYIDKVFAGDGSASTPSYTFNANTNRGLYNDVTNSAIGVGVGGVPAGRMAQTYWMTPGQIRGMQTTAPVITSCTNCGFDGTATDQAMVISLADSLASALTVTFNTAYSSKPACSGNVTPTAASNPVRIVPLATSLAVSLATASVRGDLLSIVCVGGN